MSRRSWVVPGVVLLIVLSIGLFIATSMWLVWYTLSDGSYKVALSQSLLQKDVVKTAISQAESELAPYLSQFRKFGWARSGDSIAIVGFPKLRSQLTIIPKLQQDGWSTRRFGLLVEATNAQTGHPPVMSRKQALMQAVRTIVGPAWAYQLGPKALEPAILMSTDTSLYPLTQPQQLAGVISHNSIILAASQASPTTTSNLVTLAQPKTKGEESSITIPGSFISVLPDAIKVTLFDQFKQRFGLAETNIDLVKLLSQQTTVRMMIIPSGEMSVTIVGTPMDVIIPIKDALQAQDQRQRPVRQRFKLPDGTFGYEKIPGEPEPVFSGDVTTSKCVEPLSGKSTISICRQDNLAVIATSSALAQQQVMESPVAWSGRIAPNTWQVLASSPACQKPSNPWLTLGCHLTYIQVNSDEKNIKALINL